MKMLKKLFSKFFDYDIVDAYWDHDENGHVVKKYIRKYKLRKFRFREKHK